MFRPSSAARDLRLLLTALTCSAAGSLMEPVAVIFAVLGPLGGGPSEVGTVLAAGFGGVVACSALGGVFADRHAPRRVMIAADSVSFIIQAGTAAGLAAGVMSVPILAVLAFAGSAAGSFSGPASRALLTQIVDRDDLQRANAKRSTLMSMTRIVAPLLGGILVPLIGAAWTIAVDAATFACSALLVVRIRARAKPSDRRQGGRTRAPGFVRELREGWSELTRRPWLWGTIAVFGGFELLVSAPLVTLKPLLAEDLYGGARGYSWLIAASGLGAVLGGLAAARFTVRRPLLGVAVLIFPLVTTPLALALGAPLTVVVTTSVLSGACEAVIGVLWFTTIGRVVPQEAQGRVTSWDTTGTYALRPAGLTLGGIAAVAVGSGPILWTAVTATVLLPLPLLLLGDVRTPISELDGTDQLRTASKIA
ncbi:MFS transporter [Streptomyces sp. NPDC000348]|uniref:MFS transporter n=1 Tax=Streptomyces sp. NPDC000348 TaxID=3364538 RepID=UPI003691AD5A